MKQDQIIDLIKNRQEEKAYSHLYRYFPVVRKFIVNNGGTRQDAQDIFQDALIIFTRKVQDNAFEQKAQMTTYLYGICRLLWKSHCRKQQRSQAFQSDFSEFTSIDDAEVDIEHEQKVKTAEWALDVLGAKCLQLLNLFYYQDKTMLEISKAMGFASEKLAKNQKFKCLEKARNRYQALINI